MALKKILISFFAVLNISAVIYSNRPGFVSSIQDKLLSNCFSQIASYNIRYVEWFISDKLAWYAYLVGLGNRWLMFGFQNHFNWWYQIKAKYQDSEIVLLPLPRQSQRTFLQWLLFDFKEAKILHNIYPNQNARESYAKYLCRQFPSHNNFQVDSIVWEMYWQNILEPKYAREKGAYLAPEINSQVLNVFKCPEENK